MLMELIHSFISEENAALVSEPPSHWEEGSFTHSHFNLATSKQIVCISARPIS